MKWGWEEENGKKWCYSMFPFVGALWALWKTTNEMVFR
jgi:hypothetical protein